MRSQSASPFDLWHCFAMPTAVSGLWQRTRGRTSCHSERLSQQGGWYSCKGLPELFGGGGTSVSRKKSISDPDQLRLCVTCVCLGGVGGALAVMSLECGRHQIISSHSERWPAAENLIRPEINKEIFIEAKLLRAQSSPDVLIEPELIDKSTIVLFSLLNSIYHLIWVHEQANDCWRSPIN